MTGISNLPIELLSQIFTEGCHAESTGEITLWKLTPHTRQCRHFVKSVRLVSKFWQSIVDDPGNSRTFWFACVVLKYIGGSPSTAIMARQLRTLQQSLKTSDNCEVYLQFHFRAGYFLGGIYEEMSPDDQIMLRLFIYGMNFLTAHWNQVTFVEVAFDNPQICRHLLFSFFQQGILPNLRSIRFYFRPISSIKEILNAAHVPEFAPLCRNPNLEMIRHIPQDTLQTLLANVTRLFIPHQDWIADFKLPDRLRKLNVRIHIFNAQDEIDFHRSLSSQQVFANIKYLIIQAWALPDTAEESEHGLVRSSVHSLAFLHLRKLELHVARQTGFAALWAARFLMSLNCPVLEEIVFNNPCWIRDPSSRLHNLDDRYNLAFPALKCLNISCGLFWSDIYLFSHFRHSTNLQHLAISQHPSPNPDFPPEKSSYLMYVLSGCQFQLRSIEMPGVDLDIMTIAIIFESLDVSFLRSIGLRLLSLPRLSNLPQIDGSKVKLDMPALTNIELHGLTIAEAMFFLSGINADRLERLSFLIRNPELGTEADLSSDIHNEENTFSFSHLQKLTLELLGHKLAPIFKFFTNLACKVQHLDYHYDTRVVRSNMQLVATQSVDIKKHFEKIPEPSRYCAWLEPVKGKVPFPLVRLLTGTFYIVGHLDNGYIRESIQNVLDRRKAAGAVPLELDVLEIKSLKSDYYHDGQMVRIKAIGANPSSVEHLTNDIE